MKPRAIRPEDLLGLTPAEVITDLARAIMRVEELCDRWDMLSKGESPTTKAIRAALASDHGQPAELPTHPLQ